jgi:hypothetical protein
MMKKLIILSTIIVALASCTVKEKPEFLRVENIKVLDADGRTVKMKADALFRNPNDIGGKLLTDGIKVFVNGVEMATISSEEFEVPAKEEFSIPLVVNIPTDSIFSDKSIGGLLGSLLTQKMKVQYKGAINYKVFGFSHSYTIDQVENVKIKL